MEDVGLSDTSAYARTTSTSGSVVRTDTTAAVGTYSAEFTPNAYLSVPNDVAFDFGTDDFDFEFRINFKSLAEQSLLGMSNGGGAGTPKWIVLLNYAGAPANTICLLIGPGDHLLSWSWTPSTGTWYKVEVTRTGNDFKCFIDDVQIGSTITNAISMPDVGGDLRVGNDGEGYRYVNGYMDHVRIKRYW